MRLRQVWVAACLGGLVALAGCAQDASNAGSAPTSTTPGSGSASAGKGDPSLGGRLLYSLFDEDSHTFLSTHVSRPDGQGETEIPMPGAEGGGRWSRAGDQIAVTRVLADGRIGTAILSPSGVVRRALDIPDDGLNLACTVWSPDDKRLACEGWDDADASRGGIYTVRASDGGGIVRLTRTPAGLADLVGDYSPDGKTFLFKRTTDEDPGPLMVVPTDGGQVVRMSSLDVEDAGRYSPDGKTILTSAGGSIILLDTSGHETGRITEDGTYLFGPVWAPDGEHIAFSGTSSGFHADIYTSLPDGSDLRQVTSTPDNEIRVEWGADELSSSG